MDTARTHVWYSLQTLHTSQGEMSICLWPAVFWQCFSLVFLDPCKKNYHNLTPCWTLGPSKKFHGYIILIIKWHRGENAIVSVPALLNSSQLLRTAGEPLAHEVIKKNIGTSWDGVWVGSRFPGSNSGSLKMNPLKLGLVLAWISQIPMLPEDEALDVVSWSNMVWMLRSLQSI